MKFSNLLRNDTLKLLSLHSLPYNFLTESRDKITIVNTPSTVPNGKKAHSIQPEIKLNRYFFCLAINRPEIIIQIDTP